MYFSHIIFLLALMEMASSAMKLESLRKFFILYTTESFFQDENRTLALKCQLSTYIFFFF